MGRKTPPHHCRVPCKLIIRGLALDDAVLVKTNLEHVPLILVLF
jgi:hypothetical protein